MNRSHITTACPSCSARYKVAAKSVGTAATCKKCGTRFRVAESPPPVAPTAATTDVPAIRSPKPPVVVDAPSVAPIRSAVPNVLQRFGEHGQDPELLAKFHARVSEICTSNETILYIAVQELPMIGAVVSPDAVVLTDKRFLVFRTKLLGRMEFRDCLWKDCKDIHMKENIVGATLLLTGINGHTERVEYIPKSQARMVYRHAQEMEEQGVETRRQRKMEESRAGATSINVVTPSAGSADASPTTQDDDFANLKKLKTMLDHGLIEQAEYDAKKAEILSRM